MKQECSIEAIWPLAQNQPNNERKESMKVEDLKSMTNHDKEIFAYMRKNHKGRCAYNTTKKCSGMCNNCPYDLPNHGFSKYNPWGELKRSHESDYEGAILARQERYSED